MKLFSLSLLNIALSASFSISAEQNQSDPKQASFETIEVYGELLPTTKMKAANSVDIIDADDIKKSGAAHIQDILQQVGNINYSSGSSRARFFQVRGVGERSQFVDPVNPSVGVAIDGIDYSEMANAATLFDIEQVEIYKGPQGTNIGANAMAGFINLTSTTVGSEADSILSASVGNYGYSQLAAAHGGALVDNIDYRISVNKTDGDGYIENTYLGRKDTNGVDELSIRAKFKADISEVWQSSLVLHKFDIDNGYDAFSLELDRTTLSDEPGFDRQNTTAIALTNEYQGADFANFKLFLSNSNSDLDYGYDEDWSYQGIAPYDPVIDPDGWFAEYSSTDHYLRDRTANQLDMQMSGKDSDWVVGFFFANKEVDLDREFFDWGLWDDATFNSLYQVNNLAVYGEKRIELGNNIQFSAGFRLENYDGDYSDSNLTDVNTDETMWGGHVTASKEYNESTMVYFRLSRGFKAGGVNGEALAKLNDSSLEQFHSELQQNTSFKAETLLNYELGAKYISEDKNLNAEVTLFYSARSDMQIKQWLTNNDDVPVFVGYISNAPTGSNSGIEFATNYAVNNALSVFASAAILKTEVKNFSRLETDPITWQDVEVRIDGRAQAHAPEYQMSLGAQWFINNEISAQVSLMAKDSFYYSYSHDESSDSTVLANANLTYSGDFINVTLWARNLTDENYGVRGFYFGNDPRDGYTAKNYEQFGEPMVIGLTLDYLF